jgi:hypothetical protein
MVRVSVVVRRPLGSVFSAPIVKGEQPFGIHEFARRIRKALAKSPTKLTEVFGVGSVLAAKIIGRIFNAAHSPHQGSLRLLHRHGAHRGVQRGRRTPPSLPCGDRQFNHAPKGPAPSIPNVTGLPSFSAPRELRVTVQQRPSVHLLANTRGRPLQRPRASVGVAPTKTGFSATLSITGTVAVTRRSSVQDTASRSPEGRRRTVLRRDLFGTLLPGSTAGPSEAWRPTPSTDDSLEGHLRPYDFRVGPTGMATAAHMLAVQLPGNRPLLPIAPRPQRTGGVWLVQDARQRFPPEIAFDTAVSALLDFAELGERLSLARCGDGHDALGLDAQGGKFLRRKMPHGADRPSCLWYRAFLKGRYR